MESNIGEYHTLIQYLEGPSSEDIFIKELVEKKEFREEKGERRYVFFGPHERYTREVTYHTWITVEKINKVALKYFFDDLENKCTQSKKTLSQLNSDNSLLKARISNLKQELSVLKNTCEFVAKKISDLESNKLNEESLQKLNAEFISDDIYSVIGSNPPSVVGEYEQNVEYQS